MTYFGEHQPAPHHLMLCTCLQMVVEGLMRRVMVFLPPGGAKSTYCSVYAPSWAVGRRPGVAIIAGSHTMGLARGFGRKVRNIIRDPRYREVFDTVLDPGAQAAHEWATRQTKQGDARSSEYRAAGVGVGIAGKRADLAFIDDPFRSRKDADSIVRRDEVWNWYTDDVRTRLKPGGAIVIVNTRWHEDDLCGRILPEGYNGESGWVRARDGEWWFVVSIQALAERKDDILGRQPGESYWPNYYRREWLEQQRITLTPRSWSALYQQRPAPEEGDYYKREWFQWYDPEQLPRNLQLYGASDYAVTQDGGDWTTHIVGAVAGNHMMEDLYLVDYWTGQTSSDTWIDEFITLVLRWKPTDWAEEHGQISKSLGPMIDLQQLRTKAWTNRVQFPVSGDKAQRGQAFRALAAQRRVFLPRGAAWANELLDRLLRFGASSRDDDHDACGLLGRLVYQMRGGREAERAAGKPQYGTFDWLLHVTDQQREAQRSLYRG